MGNRNSDHRLDIPKPEAPPGLEFLFAAHSVWGDPLDIGTLGGRRRMVVPVEPGGRIEGPRIRGHILPGAMNVLLIRPDGLVEAEGHAIFEMEDGPLVGFRNSGTRWISAEAAQELAEGGCYDPAVLISRSFVRFEAADDGPYAWLNRELCIAKGIRTVNGLDSTVWRIV